MRRPTNLRSIATIALTVALAIALVGCSSALQKTASTTTTPTASSTPAAAPIPAPVMKPAAAPAPAPAPSVCAATPAGVKHIYVSIGQQHLWACTGSVLLTDTAITTGASAITNVHYATPLGTSHITGKSRNTVLAGHDVNGPWNDPVKYWMPFDGGIGFHDSSWQTFPYGSDLYKTQGSHGCVHIPAAVIATLFDWAPVGTLVTVQG
jgi:lipoprotein-anchoring transpeptidase ErfK/SrfK